MGDDGAIELTVNGAKRSLPGAWRDETLLDALREPLGLVGAKYGCGIGACGACKVHVDGVAVNSCTLRTRDVEGRTIVTIEGLAVGRLHPLQQAWIAERVPQCGFCQTGQLMQAAALLAASPRPGDDEIAAAMAGNLCRCGTYERIKRAIRRASREARAPGPGGDG
jgi:isoquinoline 1-oxidoreductase alpha subunit